MKEISLKKVIKKGEDELGPAKVAKDIYPSFNIYEDAPEELMKLPMGKEVMAKIKLSSKETHEGSNTRKSIGFDILSVQLKDEEKIKKAMKDTNLPESSRSSVMNKYKG